MGWNATGRRSALRRRARRGVAVKLRYFNAHDLAITFFASQTSIFFMLGASQALEGVGSIVVIKNNTGSVEQQRTVRHHAAAAVRQPHHDYCSEAEGVPHLVLLNFLLHHEVFCPPRIGGPRRNPSPRPHAAGCNHQRRAHYIPGPGDCVPFFPATPRAYKSQAIERERTGAIAGLVASVVVVHAIDYTGLERSCLSLERAREVTAIKLEEVPARYVVNLVSGRICKQVKIETDLLDGHPGKHKLLAVCREHSVYYIVSRQSTREVSTEVIYPFTYLRVLYTTPNRYGSGNRHLL